MVKVFAALLVLSLVVGAKTYKIAEPDLLKEMEDRAKSVDIEGIRKKLEERVKNFVPDWLTYLEPAEKGYKYEVDMMYELEFDIPRVNENGEVIGVLYPKGYKFNPLKYLKVPPPVLIVFNPERELEVKYAKKIKNKYGRRQLLIVKGDVKEAIKKFKEPVYYLHRLLVNRINLKNTLSIVTWDMERGIAKVEVLSDEELKKALAGGGS